MSAGGKERRRVTVAVRMPVTVTMTISRSAQAAEDEDDMAWEVDHVERAHVWHPSKCDVNEALACDEVYLGLLDWEPVR